MDATTTPPKCSNTKSMTDLNVVTPGNEDLIDDPHSHDVLCGRGGSINSHPGNERFRELVEKRKRVYLTARFKREKRLIASSIVSEIRGLQPSGRFLTKDAKSGKWKDIGDEKARDKTSQALRENAPKVRAEIETEINKQRAEMKQNEAMEDATIAETTAIPPSPYYHAWAGGHYRPIYGYGLPPGAPPPEYPPPGPYQPYDGGLYGYTSSPQQEQQPTPSPHGSNHSHHSHQSMQTDEPNHQHSQPCPQNQTQYSHHNRDADQQPKPEQAKTFDTIPSFVSSVPSSIAAWTKNSFSFGQSMDAGDHHQPVEKKASKPIAYVHRPESDRRPPRVTFRDDYHGAHERSRHYNRPRRVGSSQFRNGYSSHRPRGPRRSAVRNHSSQRPAKRPYVQETHTDDDENNSLLSQVASHIMGSWETPIPCANGSSDDLAITEAPYQDEGQEVELVEMMSFEDPIIEEEDDIREEESQSMQPPQDRRVEIDWPSRIGSCGTWLPETSSFFSVQDNPLSPTTSMEMDQSAAFSCGGSIGGTSLCQVFANDQQMISGGPGQQDTRYLSQNPSWGHQSGHSLGQLPSWEASTNATPQMDHKTLNQIPSWERSFRSKSPCNSTICSDMSRDECDIKSMGSGDLGRGISPVPLGIGTSPRNSISQNLDLFEGRMRE